MAIVQEAFNIPNDIAVGLASGTYRRIGSVVRYATGEHKGQIVKHLKPVPVTGNDDSAASLAKQAIDFGKEHKKLMIATAVVAAGATVVGGIHAATSVHKKKRFQKAFSEYIDAIRIGNLTIEVVESFEAELANVDTIKMKASELALLVSHIHDYTLKLAEDNNIKPKFKKNKACVIELQQYIDLQKKILKSA